MGNLKLTRAKELSMLPSKSRLHIWGWYVWPCGPSRRSEAGKDPRNTGVFSDATAWQLAPLGRVLSSSYIESSCFNRCKDWRCSWQHWPHQFQNRTAIGLRFHCALRYRLTAAGEVCRYGREDLVKITWPSSDHRKSVCLSL